MAHSPSTNSPGEERDKDASFGEGIGMWHSLRYRDYRWLWLGNTFSSAAMWVQQTTIGYVAYDLTGSGALLGAINGVRNLPTLVAAPLAGVAADRISRGMLVAISQAFLFINAMFLAVIILMGDLQVWHLFLFSIVGGALNAFNMPARQTMVFDVVPREAVPNAIALNNVAQNVTRTIGPMAGGFLIVFFGPGENFLVQAIAYLAVMVTVLVIRQPPSRKAGAGVASFMNDMKEGYKWALANPQARLLVLMTMLYPLFIIPVHLSLMPILTKEFFHSDAGGLGLLLSALGAGGLIGGFIAASLNSIDRRGMVQLMALFVNAGFMIVFGVMANVTGELWIGVGMLVLSGTGGSLYLTTNQTVLQLCAPEDMRGRVTGILNLNPLFQTIGMLFTGILADVLGAADVVTINGAIMLAIGVAILVFSPRMRDLRLSRLTAERTETVARASA